MKILVVDDDYNICDLVRMYLEKEGFEVELAYDGKTAVEKFKTIAPSLIVREWTAGMFAGKFAKLARCR